MAIPARVEIPQFPGGKRIALTTSWDDGTVHDRRVVEGFNKWGIKGTFNLNSGKFGRQHSANNGYIERAEVAGLYAGHEVAVHTVTHPWLPALDASQVVTEVLEDRKALEDLVGYPVRGMAYPFGSYDQKVIEILRMLGMVYSRTVISQDNPWPAAEPLAWAATGHMFARNPDSVEVKFQKWYEATPWGGKTSGLYYIWGHSYEFNTDDPAKSWGNFERIFKPLGGKPDVWYCTNIELFDYEAARQRVVIAANRGSVYNPSGMAVTVKADGKYAEVPAGGTVRLEA